MRRSEPSVIPSDVALLCCTLGVIGVKEDIGVGTLLEYDTPVLPSGARFP